MGCVEAKANKGQPCGMDVLLIVDYQIINLALNFSSHVDRLCNFQVTCPFGFCFL